MSTVDPVHYELILEAVRDTTERTFQKDLLAKMHEVVDPLLEELAKVAAEETVQRLSMEYNHMEMRHVLRHVIEVGRLHE